MYCRGLTILLIYQSAIAANLYVSPTGTAGGAGTIGDPLSLEKAVGATSPATSGDTIWLRGGTYTGSFTSMLTAPSNSPIVIRNYNGERAIIDSTNVFSISGSGSWFWGLEFTDTSTNRDVVRNSGIGLNSGADGHDNKLINCVLHDLGNAVFVSYQSTNPEVAGCIIYNTGYQLTDRGHGHSLYVQNRSYDHQSHYQHNICFNSFGKGINCRSSFNTINTRFTANVMFSAGSLSSYGSDANFHTEGNFVDRIFFDGNLSYYPTPTGGGEFYNLATNGTIVLSNNVFANSFSYFLLWTNVVFNNNTQYVRLDVRPTGNTNYTAADYNHYYYVQSSSPVAYNQVNLSMEDWQGDYGNDTHGTWTANSASGTWTYVRVNPYETNRANITVYNWDDSDNVLVDVSAVLRTGQRYEVRNAQDYFKGAVVSGIYNGGSVSLPMTNLTVAVPVGFASAPAATGPEFNTFILLPLAGAGKATTVNAGTVQMR